MITRYPLGRSNLKIKRTDRVLEIGSGHNPMYRSNVLIDKYASNNDHRCGDICIYPHQTFIEADGEQLPFEDKTFDYVICNQVVEHVEHPEQFIAELIRVAHRGYIETPSLVGELMFPKDSHKWVILLLDGKLIFYEKSKIPGSYKPDYGELFLNYLPYQSLPFKMLTVSEPHLMINHLEWTDSLECVINPTNEVYNAYFTQKWTRPMTVKVYPPRKAGVEIIRTIVTLWYIGWTKFTEKLHRKKKPITIEEYMQRKTNKGS